ncbi:sialin-like [Amphibalanus amphitrite]|uniref:sialin-like n=1 Tax=Amphibalanus amphitrite TaxID=1232801 RepID=UPI001C9043B2|nr:sialin-like [Amphibalanus amphitrite]
MAAPQQMKKEEAGFQQPCSLLTSWRLRITLFCTLGGMVLMIARAQTSFAILCMVRDELPSDGDVKTSNDSARQSGQLEETVSSYQGEFLWDKPFQGLVLSAYFYGYVATLIPAGWLTDRLRNHRVLAVSAVVQAGLLALMPELTRMHRYSFIVLRILQGAAASVFFPAFNVVIRNWSGAGEFPLLFGLAWSGTYLGSAAAFPLSSTLCQQHQLGGWTAIYYGSGLGLALWAILACVMLNETPQHMRFISGVEKSFLASHNGDSRSNKEQVLPVSLCVLMRNLQVWIISLSYFVVAWFFAAMNITLPTFMKEGFDFDIEENGFLSALPSLCMCLFVVLGGKMFAYLHVNRGISKTNGRKIMSMIGLLLPSCCMAVLILLPASQRILGVLLSSVAVGASCLVTSAGPVTAAGDLAPQYTGIICGIAASIGNTPGFLVPLVAAAMTPNGTLQEWRWFFSITVALMVLLAVLIGTLWRSELQPFAAAVLPPAAAPGPQPFTGSMEFPAAAPATASGAATEAEAA